MKSACFLDTNILIYAATGKKDEPRKHSIAYGIVSSEAFCLSAQVHAEFYSSISRKKSLWLPQAEMEGWLDMLAEYPTLSIDVPLVRAGIYFAERYGINYFDGAILAAAERLDVPVLYTEDLKHEQTYGSVRVINPFYLN